MHHDGLCSCVQWILVCWGYLKSCGDGPLLSLKVLHVLELENRGTELMSTLGPLPDKPKVVKQIWCRALTNLWSAVH